MKKACLKCGEKIVHPNRKWRICLDCIVDLLNNNGIGIGFKPLPVPKSTDYDIEKEQMVNALASMIEFIARDFIKENIRNIINELYPNMDDVNRVNIKYFTTFPHSNKKVGKILLSETGNSISGWHGDYVALLYFNDSFVKTIIFEIKYGDINISKPQHNFFKSITNEPMFYMSKLKTAKIMIIHCHDLDTINKTVRIERWEYFELLKRRPHAVGYGNKVIIDEKINDEG